MKDFILLGTNFLIPVDQIDRIVLAEQTGRVIILQRNLGEAVADFDTLEEAKAEFSRICEQFYRLKNLTPMFKPTPETKTGFPHCMDSLGTCPGLDQLNDNEYVERLSSTFRQLGLTADAERLKKLQLVCDLKLQGETV